MQVLIHKVGKILKGILDLLTSPSTSTKTQIMNGKVCLRCKGKTLPGFVNKLFVFKSLLKMSSYVAFTPQANFPVHNLNFHWRSRWWDQIQAIFSNLLYFEFSSWRVARFFADFKSSVHLHTYCTIVIFSFYFWIIWESTFVYSPCRKTQSWTHMINTSLS